MLKGLAGILGGDLACDLGSGHTRIYCPDRGLVLEEPSVVLTNAPTLAAKVRVLAVGHQAQAMAAQGLADTLLVHPIQEGAVADAQLVQVMMQHFFQRVMRRRFMKPRVAVATPHAATAVERRAMREALLQAGAARVYPLEKSLAAAWGAGLPQVNGVCLIDIGRSTTEIGVVSLGQVLRARSLGLGGDSFDAAIMHYVRRHHGCILSPAVAVQLKESIGRACPSWGVQTLEVSAQELRGQPCQIVLDSNEILEALQPPLALLLTEIRALLEALPTALLQDIATMGLVLAGGGSLLAGFDQRLMEETGIEAFFVEEPQHCVVRGVLSALDRVPATVL